MTGLSPFNTGDCNGAGVRAVSIASSQPYTGLGMTIKNSGAVPITFALYIDDLATGGQAVQRKYAFPQVPADGVDHSYNLTWNSAFTENCSLPAGSNFDQTKIQGLGFGIETGPTPILLNLVVSDIKFTGGGSSNPCSSYCSSPKDFTLAGSYTVNSLGTGAFCYQTTSNFSGGTCGNFVSPRALFINGTQVNCNAWTTPAKVNGGYCFYGNPGDYGWAYFGVW